MSVFSPQRTPPTSPKVQNFFLSNEKSLWVEPVSVIGLEFQRPLPSWGVGESSLLVFAQPHLLSYRTEGAQDKLSAAAVHFFVEGVCVSALPSIRWSRVDWSLTNMWAACPQKEQVGNVSLSVCLSMSALFYLRPWAGGDMCLCDTPWVWVVSGIM